MVGAVLLDLDAVEPRGRSRTTRDRQRDIAPGRPEMALDKGERAAVAVAASMRGANVSALVPRLVTPIGKVTFSPPNNLSDPDAAGEEGREQQQRIVALDRRRFVEGARS